MNDKKIRPISPEEVVEKNFFEVPEEIIIKINDLLIKNGNRDSLAIGYGIMSSALKSVKGEDFNECHSRWWRLIKLVYEEAGWEVISNASGYEFSRKRK